ncbi:MAG: glycosyltransferase family 4 protein [Candidatus Sabulitectum sp.]|nr:glycosyltransferase family 4 protein [Candidatus Sabulitectum sp.]
MKIILNSNSGCQDAVVIAECLQLQGHDVLSAGDLLSESTAVDFEADAIICFDPSQASYADCPVVQMMSSSDEPVLRNSSLLVYSSRYMVPRGLRNRAVVIPFPVNVDLFRYRSPAPLRDKIIFASGSLQPAQGHRVLVQAMTLVNKDHRAVIAGSEDFYTVQQMRDHAETLGIAHRIDFPGDNEDMRSLLHSADMGVITSLENRSAPRLASMIMASGVPLLASAADGLRELLIDGVTGLFHSPGNWKQLAGQINHLIENRGLSGTLGKNAREHCEKYCSTDAVGERWTEALEQLCFR